MSTHAAGGAFLDAEARVFRDASLTPRFRSVELAQPDIRLRVIEVGEGEPTLFLHGFSLSTACWASLMSRMLTVHCIAIDMPGHGGSGGASYEGVDLRSWFCGMLSTFLDQLGLESVHVVGHSQGAMIGLWLALDAPERVRSLTAIGTPAVALGARLDGMRLLGRPVLGRMMLSMPKTPSMYRGILAGTIGAHAVAAAPQDLIRATYLGTRNPAFGKTVSTYLREMFKGLDADPQRYVLSDTELKHVETPVRIVWGSDEIGAAAVADVRRRVADVPGMQFELVPGGHAPWLDDLESTARHVASVAAN